MGVSLEKSFLYLKGIDEADVLFHIESSRFYRIYNSELKGKFQNHFLNEKYEDEINKKLIEIDGENSSCIIDCNGCKENYSTIPKEFMINKLALVLTSKCNLRCKYCYANYGMYDYEEKTDISETCLQNGLKYLMDNFKDIANIQFFGGEPSLCESQILSTVSFFEDMVETGKRTECLFLES